MHRDRRSAPQENEMNLRHAAALALVGWNMMLVGTIICVIAVHPSRGHAQALEDDWREIPPSAVPTNTSTREQDSGSGAQNDSPSLGPTTATGTISGLRSGGP